jgi:hypothetical protein
MKPKNAWVEIDPPTGRDWSADTRYFQRVIKLPFKNWSDNIRVIVNRWIEQAAWSNAPYSHCGHDYDCCGCQYAQSAAWTYSYGKLTLTVTQYYNY